MVKICPPFSSVLLSCAMKTAATHWKMAAPSMFTVAPMGRMKRLMRLSTPLFSSTHLIMEGSVAELVRGTQPHLRVAFGCPSQRSANVDGVKSEVRSASCLPGAGGEGGGEGRNEARQETERVLARGGEVDERQDDASVKDMAQDRGEDVFSQTGDQKNHIFHLYNFTGHQEYDAKRDVPENQR